MKSLVIIPSRLNSTRLPEKPLILIKGKSLVNRVYHQVKKCKNKTDILIATDNEKIVDHVKSFNGEVVLTNKKHISGTDRCNEVVQSLNKKYDLIINVQGDEPIINPKIIDEIINTFDDINDEIITVAKEINNPIQIDNENIVKVEFNSKMIAKDFFRKSKNKNENLFYKHYGIYAFKPSILKEVCDLKPTQNELSNNLEQLRWLDNNYKIRIMKTKFHNVSIDTKEDIEYLLKKYSQEL